jgi:DNA (cytosine-5)-methyltransferase 1
MDSLPARDNIREINNSRDGRKNRVALSNLREAVVDVQYQHMWPTMTVVSAEHPGRVKRKDGQQTCLSMEVNRVDETSGALNPTWVEWLMGFPLGWTDCEDSETQ